MASTSFPRTRRTVLRFNRTPNFGVQIAVAFQGGAEFAQFHGMARPSVPFSASTLIPLLCAAKPIVALAIGQTCHLGKLGLDDRVVHYIPDFGSRGKEVLTIRHLLTHTAPMIEKHERPLDPLSGATYRERIMGSGLLEGAVPGKTVSYSLAWNWYLLGEILERVYSRDLNTIVAHEILRPLNISATRFDFSGRTVKSREADTLAYCVSRDGHLPLVAFDGATGRPQRLATRGPGTGAVGPLQDLVRCYVGLLNSLESVPTGPALPPEVVSDMTRSHFSGPYGQRARANPRFGLGFQLGMREYLCGRHCSPESFGHTGSISGMQVVAAFADPRHRMAVGMVVNTAWPGVNLAVHAIIGALYEDFGLDRGIGA